MITFSGLTVTDEKTNDHLQLTKATSPGSSDYNTLPVTIGGEDSEISVAFTDGKSNYDLMAFGSPSNGLYATVVGSNQIKLSLNVDNIGSFALDHLLVTLEDANDPSIKLTIDLNINTSSSDSIMKNN